MKKLDTEGNPGNMVGLWERLELRIKKGDREASFITRINDMDKELLIVENPIRLAGDLQIEIGQQLEVVFNKKDASYTFDATVVAIDPDNENLTRIQTLSDVRRSQRRQFVRIDIAGKISYKAIDLNAPGEGLLSLDKKGELLNVSAGGILLCTSENLMQNDLVLLNFSLKNNQRLENILGIVKRLEKSDQSDSKCADLLVGIEFLTKEKALSMIPVSQAEHLPPTLNYFSEALEKLVVHFIYKQQVETRKRMSVDS
ncbi:MAG: hypothetical protein GY839_09815 [candidate division Zixibacteria bacterium]|nr:hypothetical protein [candidate division Zixibacteria bacterium]